MKKGISAALRADRATIVQKLVEVIAEPWSAMDVINACRIFSIIPRYTVMPPRRIRDWLAESDALLV